MDEKANEVKRVLWGDAWQVDIYKVSYRYWRGGDFEVRQKPGMMESLKVFLSSFVVSSLFRFLGATWRIKYINRPDKGPYVYAHWHGDELLLVGAFRDSQMAVMSSRSRDGELMKRVLTRLGYHVVRGSSSRGGAGGLKGLLDAVRGGHEASLAVDGPRGPLHVVKPGILKLSQSTGVALVVGVGACERKFVFKKAWNRCYLPLPFTRCVVEYGEPLHIPAGLEKEDFERYRLNIENQLKVLKSRAEAQFLGGTAEGIETATESARV